MADLNTNADNDGIEDMVRDAVRAWQNNDTLVQTPTIQSPTESESRTRAWLDNERHMADGGVLSLTFKSVPIKQFRIQMGNRLLFWPAGVEERRRISVVSSRLRERKDLHRHWFDALRTIAVRCHPQQECLCVVEGTAACDAVSRAAALFGIPLLKITVNSGRTSEPNHLIEWCRSTISQPPSTESQIARLWISPEFITSETATDKAKDSEADVASSLVGDRVVALSCRDGGTIQRVLLSSLQQQPKRTILLVDDPQHANASGHATLTDAGAVRWLLDGQQQTYVAENPVSNVKACETTADADMSSVTQRPDEWLCHWTRPRRGPWPNESVDDYWDALIMGCASADHSALGALLRIMETQQLLPSDMAHGAVSWTAVPLNEFRRHRVYRRHLRRYDFEPWGIALRRSVLEELGCRPVTYLQPGEETTETSWQTHPATDAAGKIDWTTEREWRIHGNVDLKAMPASDIIVFADSEAEAAVLRQTSPWHVMGTPSD